MLKALLHGKLRLSRVNANDEDQPSGSNEDSERLTGLEDPLTAAVFGRFAYLPSELAWSLLSCASERLGDGPALPQDVPYGVPSWSFWPSLRPSEEGTNTRRVEPDVVVSWGETRLLIEAKHRGVQAWTQWVEQIRAVREHDAHAGRALWLVAVGGIELSLIRDHHAHAHDALKAELPGLLTLRWEDLREGIHARDMRALPPEQATILRDIAAALDAWGYRRKSWFKSLPDQTRRLRCKEASATLRDWMAK